MKLVLGVVDLPYSRRGRRGSKGSQTTGDIAEILESKYHVMAHFVEQHGPEIGDDLANAMAGNLESILMGAPPRGDMFAGATSQIEDRFRKMLAAKELDALGYPGIPTEAALKGVSHRFKGKRSGGPRPSFQDTGLYSSSFKAQIE
jgi:hypothetical protein